MQLRVGDGEHSSIALASGAAASKEVRAVTMAKILLFGDSITEMSSVLAPPERFNIVPALQAEYQRKLQVVARGYGGYTSEHARYIIEPTLDAETLGGSEIAFMTLFFGTNDANALSARRLSLQRYVENVRYILGVITARGIKVVVVGPSAVNEEAPGLVNNDTMRHLAYAEAAKRVAREQGVPFIDLWHAFLAEKGWREGEPIPGRRGSGSEVDLSDLLSDGVHFTGKGYQIWFRELLTVVRVHWPELKSEELKSVLPSIDDLPYRDLPDALWRGVEERP